MRSANLRLFVFICSLLACVTFGLAQSFTLEQVIGFPFPSGLVAAARSNRVAWVFDAKGVRNVWVADVPDFARTARQLTHLHRGLRTTDRQFAPDSGRQDCGL